MMKVKNILYIGAALLLAGCSNETELTKSDTLSGGEKTPLRIAASLNSGNAITRAANDEFKSGDQLLAYIRHIDNTNEAVASYTSITADQAPRLVTFTKGSAAMADANTNDNIKETTDLTVSYTSAGTPSSTVTALYWDDFSVSDDTPSDGYGDFDLRTANHGLQSYYGYCYNGGTPSTNLNESTGVLEWSVQAKLSTATDETTAANIQNSDLLWSSAQQAVSYAHKSTQFDTDNSTKEHGVLTIPYTHAMSEVTVTVTADEGFDADNSPLSSTKLVLYGVNTTVELNAPAATFTTGSTSANIKMYAESYTPKTLTRDFTAIIAPGSTFTVGNKLLDINNVEDNDYTVTITTNMLTSTAWASGHASGHITTDGNGNNTAITTEPGVNYHLDVTVKKTAIQTKATLANWKTVNATGTGDIVFDNDQNDESLVMDDSEVGNNQTDVKVVAVDKNMFKDKSSFSLFTLKSTTDNSSATNRTNSAYTFATVSTFNDNTDTNANDEWINSPEIYWPNKKDNYYFRALAQFNSTTNSVNDIAAVGKNGSTLDKDQAIAVSHGTITGGKDILWGTTAKHKGTANTQTTYERGQAIPPRTGGVPIAFEHVMSKITVNLATTNIEGDPSMYNSKVDLSGATIAISNLYTSGTITIENGTITYTDANKEEAAIAATAAPLSEYIVVPQTISDDAILTVTLKDGTTYKLQLNQCTTTTTGTNNQPVESKVSAWARGTHYTYTIHLEKEKITFRVLIKEWDQVTGSGNANLEWD